MPYSFFGSIDSVYIDNSLVFDKKDNNSKGRIDIKPNSWLPIGEEEFSWSGHLYYNGNTSQPLADRNIVIKDFQNDTLYQTTTNSNGYYSFNNLDINVASNVDFYAAPENNQNWLRAGTLTKLEKYKYVQKLIIDPLPADKDSRRCIVLFVKSDMTFNKMLTVEQRR